VTATPLLSPLVRKEFRALLPFWLATLGTMAVIGLSDAPVSIGVLAYMLGTTTIGAFAIGHEYSSGTLAQLLAQPGSRIRLLLTKLAVLGPMLFVLATAAVLMIQFAEAGGVGRVTFSHDWTWAIVLLPLVVGLTMAPWFTMCCRNTMAGVVFTIAIPAGLWIVTQAIDAALHGPHLKNAEAGIGLPVLWAGTLIAGVIGGVLGPRMFLRLQAIDSKGELAWPSPRSTRRRDRHLVVTMRGRRRRHPILHLAIKELRLQAASFVFAAMYVLARIAIWFSSAAEPAVTAAFSNGITTLHLLLIAVLPGALASAEERAFGTREWQALQPLAYRAQWAIKVGITVTLALLLALALPFALDRMSPPAFQIRFHVGPLPMAVAIGSLSVPLAAVVVTLVACGLYVSSLCTGGLSALLATFPFVAVGAALTGAIDGAASNTVWTGLDMNTVLRAATMQKPPRLTADELWWYELARSWLMAGLAAALMGVLLWFAASNHRSSEHGATLLKRQIGWLAAYAATAGVTMGALPFLILWILALR
jgi:hypothetical protein